MNNKVPTSCIAKASPNIALLKYWGKLSTSSDEDRNLATNASLSLTLSKAQTTTEVVWNAELPCSVVELNGKAASTTDHEKILRHVERVANWLKEPLPIVHVNTSNNFPKGTGLASSASGFAALTMAAVGACLGKEASSKVFTSLDALSELARRGSGSACRSLSGPWMLWEGRFAKRLPYNWKLRDTMVFFSSVEKSVPSSEGHLRASSSPSFEDRLQRLPQRLNAMLAHIEKQNLQALGPLIEEEAFELHQIVESSTPPITYQLPETRRFLQALRELKHRDFFATLDAGPNVHLLSERPIRKDVESLLKALSIDAQVWEDEAGDGSSTNF
jgi:diphosphomevalonate decarboxylase